MRNRTLAVIISSTLLGAAAANAEQWTETQTPSQATTAQATVGTSGADLNFSAVAWTSGGTVEITGGTVTEPLS